MILTIVSGKGGAGKTTLAVAIAEVLKAEFYDLDVDAPNAEYFLQPAFSQEEIISQPTPEFDEQLCDACGRCTKECRFNALYKILDKVYLTDQLCHGCGVCEQVCPHQAISFKDTPVGRIRSGHSERIGNMTHIGDLNVGSTRATYLISELVKRINPRVRSVIDGPPGNSCAAVAAIKPADFVILVAEPTPFGMHDMQQTEQILRDMNKNYAIIANKVQSKEILTTAFEKKSKQPITSFPLDAAYHQSNLAGKILSREFPEVQQKLSKALSHISELTT